MAQPQFPHGRGGAGNFTKERTQSGGTADLATPTLKSDKYTTGRGGQGNMAKNDFGQESRAAQDVDAPASLQREREAEPAHYGRGGAANVTGQRREGSAEPKEKKGGEKKEGLLEKLGLKKEKH